MTCFPVAWLVGFNSRDTKSHNELTKWLYDNVTERNGTLSVIQRYLILHWTFSKKIRAAACLELLDHPLIQGTKKTTEIIQLFKTILALPR